MTIAAFGDTNTTALVTPDLLVQIVPPQVLTLNGVPTDILGVVGTASWGPVGQPVTVSDSETYAVAFGYIQARKCDAGTIVATAIQQGASNFRVVRVTDGTDTAASGALGTALTLIARYSGSTGNSVKVSILPGGRPNTYRVTVSVPGSPAEVFDGIAGTDNPTLWAAAANAINTGAGTLRGTGSAAVVAAVGSDANGAFAGSATLSGGTDGAAVTPFHLVGTDTFPRQGAYALRGLGCGLAVVADLDDSAHWTDVDAIARQEQFYAVQVTPSGDTITSATAAVAAAGLNDTATKMMFGDWLTWNDPTNQVERLVSPQGFVAGRLANLSPEGSSLNKPLFGIVASERSAAGALGNSSSYSRAETDQLFLAGIDVVTNPIPRGANWGVRGGINASTDPRVNGDNYTRLTNYIARTLNGGMGLYIGEVISPDLLFRARSTLLSFLDNMLGQGLLVRGLDGSLPYGVKLDASNNPQSRTSLGCLQANVQVRYGAILKYFIVNLEGGQTVSRHRPERRADGIGRA